MRHILIFLLPLLQQQDPAKRIEILVEQMRSGDIVQADKATEELRAFGLDALPALRDQLQKHAKDADVHARLSGIVRGLEPFERLARKYGPVPRVKLSAKARPIGEVLAEISRQSKITVTGVDLPAALTATVELDGIVWKAVDDLCRTHGGLMFSCKPDRIEIRAAPYRAIPAVHSDRFWFLLHLYEWFCMADKADAGLAGADQFFWLVGGLVLPPNVPVIRAELNVELADDGKGTAMIEGAGLEWIRYERRKGAVLARGMIVDLPGALGSPPSKDSDALIRLAGNVGVTVAMEWKAVIAADAPFAAARTKFTNDAIRVEVHGWGVTAGVLSGRISVCANKPVVGVPHWRAAFSGKSGELANVDQSTLRFGLSDGEGMYTASWNFSVPCAAGDLPTKLEIREPSATETLRIPFDFKRVPLK